MRFLDSFQVRLPFMKYGRNYIHSKEGKVRINP